MDAIQQAKDFLASQFQMKDMGRLRYFLGLEIDRCVDGLFLSQRKYVMDILAEYGMVNCIPLKFPMDSHVKLTSRIIAYCCDFTHTQQYIT